jgi:dienelactone hydrolase
MRAIAAVLLSLAIVAPPSRAQDRPATAEVEAALKEVSAEVAAEADRESLRTMLRRSSRAQIREANERSTEAWNRIKDRQSWERFRDERLLALRRSLGDFPNRPRVPRMMVTGTFDGDGFSVRNLCYESRPGLVVTANLYVPKPLREAMPGIVLSHSHHNPKEQGELQDMGMTWARAGCYVLAPDHLGHGERRQHPFVTGDDYPKSFQVGRQDYYFRHDVGLQLYLAGETLMGWMVHDLMTGVDVLLAQPGVDADRIILLGAVAGGGDPAGVTAALDERIAAVAPFNFGGPQPESPYPLPDDAESTFNYAGSGSWESTRNLYRSASDGFLPWAIVGSVAPRRLIHAHEFAWDQERDPVWKRYQTIWKWYEASDRLAFTHGHGGLTSTDPPGSHCNNIGKVHRQFIHEAFRRWFEIDVEPEDEYSQRLSKDQLLCLTESAKRELKPKPVHQILAALVDERLSRLRRDQDGTSPERRRESMVQQWKQLLGDTTPSEQPRVRPGEPEVQRIGPITVRRMLVESEPGIDVPVMTLSRTDEEGRDNRRLTVRVASDGMGAALSRGAAEIATQLSEGGTIVALIEVRGTGHSSPSVDRGPQGEITSHAATQLMLGKPLLAGQLRDLRATVRIVRQTFAAAEDLSIVGDAGVTPLPRGSGFAYPRRVADRPREVRPSGPLLALLLALHEPRVSSVEAHAPLVSFRSTLDGPFVQAPLEAVVPGMLTECDMPDLVAALSPRNVRLYGPVDGLGRAISTAGARSAYQVATDAYAASEASDAFRIRDIGSGAD